MYFLLFFFLVKKILHIQCFSTHSALPALSRGGEIGFWGDIVWSQHVDAVKYIITVLLGTLNNINRFLYVQMYVLYIYMYVHFIPFFQTTHFKPSICIYVHPLLIIYTYNIILCFLPMLD